MIYLAIASCVVCSVLTAWATVWLWKSKLARAKGTPHPPNHAPPDPIPPNSVRSNISLPHNHGRIRSSYVTLNPVRLGDVDLVQGDIIIVDQSSFYVETVNGSGTVIFRTLLPSDAVERGIRGGGIIPVERLLHSAGEMVERIGRDMTGAFDRLLQSFNALGVDSRTLARRMGQAGWSTTTTTTTTRSESPPRPAPPPAKKPEPKKPGKSRYDIIGGDDDDPV
jgi:hypothetical protein